MPFSLRARVVVPVDRPPIENGVVTVNGERIVAVNTNSHADDVIDLGSVALLPGFVNAHTHLEFSYLQQPLGSPGMSLVNWIRLVIAERGRGEHSRTPKPDRGLFESLASGTLTIGDITTGAVTLGADVTHFHEVIAFSRARAESAMLALVERMNFQPEGRRLITHGISPHAPYTVSPKLVGELVSLSRKKYCPMAMHLAESQDELALLRDGTGPFHILLEERSMWDPEAIPRGSRPLDYLHMLAESPRTLVIHGNYLDDEELNFLAAQRERMSLVYCPRTHAYFFHPQYPLGKALAAGVRVALGTDSRASNPDLNLLTEMRHVMHTHPWLAPHRVLQLGTLNGAEALGRHGDVGSITAGKLANLVAVPIADYPNATPDDILAEIFSAETAPSAIYLSGRPLNA